MNNEPVEKKRGRKKKENSEVLEPVEKKKRGRKKKWESFAHTKVIMPESDEESVQHNDVNNIDSENYEKESVAFGNLNITVHTNKEISNTDKIKSTICNNINSNNRLSTCKIELSNSDIEDNTDDETGYEYVPKNSKIKLMRHYDNIYSEGKELERTNVYCFNCCHPFYNKPFTLPIDYHPILKRYKVFGNFCSPNCAKRYAMDDKKLSNTVSILSQMCREMYSYSYTIKAAPSRFTLKCFGGKLSIEDYRNSFLDKRVFNLKPVNSKVVYLEIAEL